MKKKLKDSAGFSLVEMLCAVAVLILLCMMLNSGLSMAMKAYFDITAESETQLLLNSLTNAIAGELRYAHEVSGTDEPVYNDGRRLVITDGQVYVNDTELLPKEKDDKGGAYHGKKYKVVRLSDGGGEIPLVRYEDGCFTVNFKVISEDGRISAETPEDGLMIRCLNPPKEEGET